MVPAGSRCDGRVRSATPCAVVQSRRLQRRVSGAFSIADVGRLTDWAIMQVERAIAKLSVWAALGLAVLVYVGIGLALPLGVASGRGELVLLNLLGASWAFVIVIVRIDVYQERLHRRLLLEWTTDLRQLSAT
jgi:hypothetical protein